MSNNDNGSTASNSSRYVTELQPGDVLFGRGSGPNDHPGNIRFRQLVAERKTAYMSTSHRMTKAKIAREIVDLVEGRFLKKVEGPGIDFNTDVYEIVDDNTVMEKAKQALRQNATKTREEAAKKQQQEHQSRPTGQKQYTQSLPINYSSDPFYDIEPIPLKSESTKNYYAKTPVDPQPPSVTPKLAWEDSVPEMQTSATDVLPGFQRQQQQQEPEEPYFYGAPATQPRGEVATTSQHRYTASAPVVVGHLAELSMAEIPSEEAFDHRRSSISVSELFQARHDHYNNRTARRPHSPSTMDDLMDSFSQMKTGGTTVSSTITDPERRIMASAETMGTIEHLGSVTDMSLGTMGSSTFSIFGTKGHDSLNFEGAAAVHNLSNSHTPLSAPSPHTSSSRSTKQSHQSDASLSISEVYTDGANRRKSSSLSGSTINGKIAEIMRQVDAETTSALPRSIGIVDEEENNSLFMGDSSLGMLRSALDEGAEEEAENDADIVPPTYADISTSTTSRQQQRQQLQQPYYKDYATGNETH